MKASNPELLNNSQNLEEMLFDLPIVGAEILKRWDFSEALCRSGEHLDINRNGDDGQADYADIVQVALIETIDPNSSTHWLVSTNPLYPPTSGLAWMKRWKRSICRVALSKSKKSRKYSSNPHG